MKRNKRNFLAYRNEFLAGRIGIRGKLLLYLALLIGFIISLVWICQIALLFNFYRSYRTQQVNTAADSVIQNIDNEDLDDLADRLSADNDLSLMICGENGDMLLAAEHVRYSMLSRMKEQEINRLAEKAPEDGSAWIETVNVAPFQNENYRKEQFTGQVPENEARTGTNILYARRVRFKDGRTATLIISAQITPMASTLATLRRQFLYIFVTVLIATVVIGYSMAWSVSKPIIETNEAAKELGRSRYSRPVHSGGYREIAELNDTLVQAAQDLGNVERLQRELIANISHDLRTPLTMIQGYAETMRDFPQETTPENMQIIIDETRRLSSMVNEVLDFSRLRSGNIQINISEFNSGDTVKRICERISAMTEAEGYRIFYNIEEDKTVYGDQGRIEQVIYNLIGNALTYTGKDKTVHIIQSMRGENLRISVADTGEGIAPSELPYIWDRYYRSRESHKRAVIGSGLGLNICRGILENHHVPYGVNSEEGKGTTFWFELPTADRKRGRESV